MSDYKYNKQINVLIMSQRDEEERPLNEEDNEAPERQQSFWQKIKESLGFFKDYYTSKNVAIRDRRLGFIYNASFVIICLYLVIVVFLINKQYLDQEKVTGDVFITLIGSARSTGETPYV